MRDQVECVVASFRQHALISFGFCMTNAYYKIETVNELNDIAAFAIRMLLLFVCVVQRIVDKSSGG